MYFSRTERKVKIEDLILMTPTEEFLYNSYHQLTVLQNNWNRVLGVVPLIAETLGSFVIVLNLFLAVTFRSASAFVIALMLLYLGDIYFSCLARVYSYSSEAIQSWRVKYYQGMRRNGGHVFWKFQKSARPIRISVGSFFFIDKPFVLTFVAFVVDQAVDLIISYN